MMPEWRWTEFAAKEDLVSNGHLGPSGMWAYILW